MVVDHDEMAQLLGGGAASDVAAPAPPAPAAIDLSKAPEDVRRLLKLRVPVIVRLASCRISVASARKLSLGLILEFAKPVNEDLELLVNNREIGTGETVKVGEKFGLSIKHVRSRQERIRALGG